MTGYYSDVHIVCNTIPVIHRSAQVIGTLLQLLMTERRLIVQNNMATGNVC